MRDKRWRNYSFFTVLLMLLVLTISISLVIGRYDIGLKNIIGLFVNLDSTGANDSGQLEAIIVNIRLPRILAALLIGGSLSITGAVYQALFRNPMVSPSILGVSSGAGFGAALAIILGLSPILRQGFSFLFGIMAVFIVYVIGMIAGKKYGQTLTLILGGMIVTTVFTALISILKYIADPNNVLPSIVYWLMGGLSDIEFRHIGFIGIVSISGLVVLSLSGWKLDLFSFGDEEARALGLPVNRFRLLIIIVATFMSSAAVSISGIIGWVGLLVPHITRMVIGPVNAVVLPASFLMGGIFMIIVDDFSRSLTVMEIPLGITTSLLGAPFFLYVLIKKSGKQE